MVSRHHQAAHKTKACPAPNHSAVRNSSPAQVPTVRTNRPMHREVQTTSRQMVKHLARSHRGTNLKARDKILVVVTSLCAVKVPMLSMVSEVQGRRLGRLRVEAVLVELGPRDKVSRLQVEGRALAVEEAPGEDIHGAF